ncbi:MAG: DUF1800 domain-containing protein [Pseudomonadota bacterium]
MNFLSGRGILLFSSALLTVGAGFAIGSEMSGDNTEELEQVASVTSPTTMAVEVDEEGIPINPIEADQLLSPAGTYLKFVAQTAGTFVVTAPSEPGGQILIDGDVVVDASGLSAEDADPLVPFKSFVALTAGDHIIELLGPYQSGKFAAQITIGQVGGQSTPLAYAATAVESPEARQLIASLTGRIPTEGVQGQQGLFPLGAGRVPFTIGGSSSTVSRTNAAAAGANSGSSDGSSTMPGAAAMQMAAATQQGSGGSTTTSGSGTSTGSGSSGGSDNVVVTPPANAPGTPGNGSQNPTTPAPVTPVTPIVVDPTAATASPLTPPTGVQITQAVQLTSAGSEEGIVANSGSTLFGQVQDPQAFDIVNATIAPSGRTATVDVGATNGQFAVRLFTEDFDGQSNIQVTLSAANSTNTEVESLPVTYAFTGQTPTDGLAQALGRLTFGATPELYARVQAIGFEAFVNEQLNPDAINDNAFEGQNPQQLYYSEDNNQNQTFRSLNELQIAYAAFTQKQLNEVMANFWFNHFHASPKSNRKYQQVLVDRNAFRDLALTNFDTLLQYSAKSPLMSEFLDNDDSRAGNLNENYARELLELHTVGVDGGYGDEDIIEVARVFTGWRYRQTNEASPNDAQPTWEFEFQSNRHDDGTKTIAFINEVVGGGQAEGERLLSILAQLPQTRDYVCGKLVGYLVSDTPVPSMQANCAAAWEATNGDVKEILRSIILDTNYITNADIKRNKIKTPFEYAVSAVRVLGVVPDFSDDNYLDDFRQVMEDAGFNPMFYPVPTGLAEVGDAWLGSASVQMAFERMSDVVQNSDDFGIDTLSEVRDAGLETAEEVAAYLLALATADHYSLQEFNTLVAVLKGEDGIFEPQIADETDALVKAKGLLVVMPNFQVQ